MGLFGSREKIRDAPTEDVVIPEYVARAIPDVGKHFLFWLGEVGVDGPLLDEVAAHVDALRGENGWINLDKAGQFGWRKYKNGPLTILSGMTAHNGMSMAILAGDDLRGADKRMVTESVKKVLHTQGHAAAVAWVIAARPEGGPFCEFFAELLLKGWNQHLQTVTGKDVNKAFRKWRR